MNTILSILLVLAIGTFAFITFILAEHKEEIWEEIEFKEDEKSNSFK